MKRDKREQLLEQIDTLVRHPAGSASSVELTQKLRGLLREVEAQIGQSKRWSPAAAEAAMLRLLAQGADAMDRGPEGICGIMNVAASLGLARACQGMRETLKGKRGGPAVERALIEMLMAGMEQQSPGARKVAQATFEDGVELGLLDRSGRSALGVAVEFERWNLVAAMSAAGADPFTGVDYHGNTPAHVVVRMSAGTGPMGVLSKALELQDNVDRKNLFGRTMLWCAVEARQTWAVNELLSACADPRAIDYRGETPLSMAKKMKESHLIELLTVADERWELAGAGWGPGSEESATAAPRVRRRI